MTSPKNGRKTFSQLSQLAHGRGNGWAIQITKPRSKETALDSGKSARGSINSLRQFKVQWVPIVNVIFLEAATGKGLGIRH